MNKEHVYVTVTVYIKNKQIKIHKPIQSIHTTRKKTDIKYVKTLVIFSLNTIQIPNLNYFFVLHITVNTVYNVRFAA